MEILAVLIPLSLVLVMLVAAVLWWAVKHDQFDDLEAAGARVLLDDDAPQDGRGSPGATPTGDDMGSSLRRDSGEVGGKLERDQVLHSFGQLRSPTASAGRGE